MKKVQSMPIKALHRSFLSLVRPMISLGFLVAVLTVSGVINASAQSPASGFHVTICHRTGSASNPYIIISPDVEGVVNGHLDHEQTGNGLGGDIIPVFTFNGVTYSKNLSTDFGNGITGARILASRCRMPVGATPTPTPRVTPTPPPPPPGTPPPPAPVPEPQTIILFGIGLLGLGVTALRKFWKV